MGQALMRRDDTGLMLPIGEIMRTAKNAIRTTNGGSDNRTRYSLLGDPAMRLVLPSNRVVLESINGEAVTPQTQVTIMARQTITARGYVADHTGSRISDFNGSLMLNIHDAEYSTTSTGIFADDTEGKPVTFDEQGSLLYSGRTQVVNGEWELTLTMPSEVTHNFRPAAMNLYATSSNSEMDATATSLCTASILRQPPTHLLRWWNTHTSTIRHSPTAAQSMRNPCLWHECVMMWA